MKEQLSERLKLLENQFKQTLANLNVIEGAMIECRYWIAESDKPKEPEEEKVA